jgi:hypothetical protein
MPDNSKPEKEKSPRPSEDIQASANPEANSWRRYGCGDRQHRRTSWRGGWRSRRISRGKSSEQRAASSEDC